MKQVLIGQGGEVGVFDVPSPTISAAEVLIASEYSLISTGTETTVRRTAQAPMKLAHKALTDASLRAKGLDRVRTRGLRATLQEAQSRASRSQVVGYSVAGRVLAIGQSVRNLTVGQRVTAAGAGYANHAELIAVPRSLVCQIPDNVPAQDAAYTTVAAVALHAFRLSRASLGESVAIVGLGLVGQLAAQVSDASGCVVFGAEPQSWRCDLASTAVPRATFHTNLERLANGVEDVTRGTGVDAILIAAGGNDAQLVNRAMTLVRDRGRVVVIGDVRLALSRDILYRKELELVVSRSYGPGRYDPEYEERGTDYPVGYVRWTEGRNFGAVLNLMAEGRLHVDKLTSAVVSVDDAARAYALTAQSDSNMGVLIKYGRPTTPAEATGTVAALTPHSTGIVPAVQKGPATRARLPDGTSLTLALVGPGQFAMSVLGPHLKRTPMVEVTAVVARQPARAREAADRLGASWSTTNIDEVLGDPEVRAVVIATRHDTHADLAIRAITAGKHVFMEKPLGLTVEECERVVDVLTDTDRLLMIDFNRRFSPHALLLKREIAELRTGMTAIYRVNAGPLPVGHWTLDPKTGGGRLLGEAVHFLDLLCWLFDTDPIAISADPRSVPDLSQELVCTLTFPGGSSGTLIYTTHGGDRMPKERIEVFAGGHGWVLDDFRRTERDGRNILSGKQQKGHREAFQNFVDAVHGTADIGVTVRDGARATGLVSQAYNSPAGTPWWDSGTQATPEIGFRPSARRNQP